MPGVTCFHTLKFKVVVHDKRVKILVDGAATHNFVDATLVENRNITTEKLEGFTIFIQGNHSMECTT